MRPARTFKSLVVLTFVPLLMSACAPPAEAPAPPPAVAAAPAEPPGERGKYLVTIAGCDDCHTPKVFGPQGPKLDMSRRLSGHPAAEKLPKTPAGVLGPDKFGALVGNHLSAWVGPWGTSYTANLTPDKTTGLGSWTEEMLLRLARLPFRHFRKWFQLSASHVSSAQLEGIPAGENHEYS